MFKHIEQKTHVFLITSLFITTKSLVVISKILQVHSLLNKMHVYFTLVLIRNTKF
jgi:hypothetical protein